MKESQLPCLVICLCLFICQLANAQQKAPSVDSLINLPTAYLSKVQHKYGDLDDRLTQKTEKYLQRLFNREKKIQRKLSKIDSAGAQQLFANSEKQYAQLAAKVKSAGELKVPGTNGAYIPLLDSVKTSLSFLEQNNSLVSKDAQRVITGREQKTALALGLINKGEATRQDHNKGKLYLTSGTTTTNDAVEDKAIELLQQKHQLNKKIRPPCPAPKAKKNIMDPVDIPCHHDPYMHY